MNYTAPTAALPGSGRPCWHCRHFDRMIYSGRAAWCNLANAPRVQAGPGDGCSAWERLPGADDEWGPPACLQGARASAVRPFKAPAVELAWAP
jgi:hypothetical protein